MGSITRKLERNIIRNKVRNESGSNKGFKAAWNAYRESKYIVKDEDGKTISNSTPKNTMPKKQAHFDNAERYFDMFAWAKSRKDTNAEVAVETK